MFFLYSDNCMLYLKLSKVIIRWKLLSEIKFLTALRVLVWTKSCLFILYSGDTEYCIGDGFQNYLRCNLYNLLYESYKLSEIK